MPEDLGTVNLKEGSQTREIDLLRKHYRTHRESLTRLISDAPSQHLAAEYQRLISDIDLAVRKLDELEGKPATSTIADTNPMMKTGPGNRPLVRQAEPAPPLPLASYRAPVSPNAQSRIAIIVIAGIVVVAIIGWLIWRASSERKAPAPIVEQPGTTNAAPPPTITPAPAPATVLKITPAVADYGTIRKGTRAVRQFEISNSGDSVMEIELARSGCRCLYYDYNGKLPAKGKETITVTVDGAKAKGGPLHEQIEVHDKNDPSVSATFGVQAMIR